MAAGELEARLEGWVGAGLITDDQATAIRAYEDTVTLGPEGTTDDGR